MNRTTLSLIAGATGLAVITGLAALTAPSGSASSDAGGPAERRPVQRSSLLCPSPGPWDLAETSYTSFTPGSKDADSGGAAELHSAAPAADSGDDSGGAGAQGDGKNADEGKDKPGDTADDTDKGGADTDEGDAGGADKGGADGVTRVKPVLSAKKPDTPVTADDEGADRPALIGSADGSLAPGWTAQETTKIAAGDGRGLFGVSCSAPDTDFWFPGASTMDARSDYVHLTNPDDSAAVADIELYGTKGAVTSDVGEDIQVGPHQSVPVLLSTLTGDPQADLTVHVSVRSGRVAAALQATEANRGGDWLAQAGEPAGSLVLPGIPKDATAARLTVFAPGDDDADLSLKLASPTGPLTPAGHETVHVKSGMTAAEDLGDITRGEAGSLLLTPSPDSSDSASSGHPVPVVAALQVTRGKGDHQETAFIPATAAVGERATAVDNRAKGTTLSLVAPDRSARVRVTSSAGTEGGSPVAKTYTVKRGTTLAIRPPTPSGLKGGYAVTVQQVSGGPVYASRTLEAPEDGIPMFTVQTLPDDRGTVRVPRVEEDVAVLQE